LVIIVSLVATTIVAAGKVVSATLDNTSMYPLVITLTGSPYDVNITLGNTRTFSTKAGIDANTFIEPTETNANWEPAANPIDSAAFSSAVVTSTITLPTDTSDTASFTDGITPPTLPSQINMSTTATIASEIPVMATTIVTDTSTLLTRPASTSGAGELPEETLASTTALQQETKTSTTTTPSGAMFTTSIIEDGLTNPVSSETEPSDLTTALPEETLPDITSSQTTDFTGTTTASQEILSSTTMPISATTNLISSTTTYSPVTFTETSNTNAVYEDSILCEGWLLGMMGISGAASLGFFTSLILSSRKPKR
jgi:hypothetical protein